MKIFYMGLEPYEGRYTLQLQDWTERAYKKRGVEYVVVPGTTIDDTKAISVGQVLDAHGEFILWHESDDESRTDDA